MGYKTYIVAAAASLSLIAGPAMAQGLNDGVNVFRGNPYIGDSRSEYPDGYKPITNMEFLGLNRQSADTLLFQADYALKAGNFEAALVFVKKSLAENDEDADAHCIYAQALEKKLRAQEKRDPKLFNKCIREWLIVMREERGGEKGLYWHGFATPLGRSFGDEDHSLLAAQHLYKLTGNIPRNGQSDKKYLSAVLKPTTTEVRGKILNQSALEPEPIKLADEKSDDDDDTTKKTKKTKRTKPPVDEMNY